RKQAERASDVTMHRAPDGMAELRVFLPAPLAAPIKAAIDTYARTAKDDGDPRPIGQLRVGVLADLVLRPWDTSRPPVTAHVTILAPLGTVQAGAAGHDACAVGHLPSPDLPPSDGCGRSEPAEMNGQPITAGQLRALLEQL